MLKILSTKQNKVFNFIKGFIEKNHVSPTVREIAEGISVKSARTVSQYLEKLEEKGFIVRNKNQNRNIEIIQRDGQSDFVNVRVLGSAGCDNKNIFADDVHDEYIPIDKKIVGNKNIVAVRAEGESMLGANIQPNDYCLVEKIDKPDNNDIVLAIVDGMAVIKKLTYSNSRKAVVLSPEPLSDKYKPIVVQEDNLKVFGRVLDIIKNPINEEIQYIEISD